MSEIIRTINEPGTTKILTKEEFLRRKKIRMYTNYAKVAIGTAFISVVATITSMNIKNKNNINDLAVNDQIIENYFETGNVLDADKNASIIKSYQSEILNKCKICIAQHRGMNVQDYDRITIYPHPEKTGEFGGILYVGTEQTVYDKLDEYEKAFFKLASDVTRESTKDNSYGELKSKYDARFVKLLNEYNNLQENEDLGKSK